MLTTYFKRQTTIAAYRAGPAGAYLDKFTACLAKRGYGNDAVRHLLRGAIEFATWMQSTRSSLTTLPVSYWRDFCEHLAKRERLHGARGQHSICWRGALHFVEFLRIQHGIAAVEVPEQTVPPELVVAFERWMAVHRGIKSSSLATYRPHIVDLLVTLGHQPDQFSAASLHAFILAYAKHSGRAAARTRVKATRMFCRFLIATGRCQTGLDAAVPDVAAWRLASLPRYLPPEDIERVLAACNGERPIDMRDKAILLLLARLGLRASDVVDLKLDDIDWLHGKLTVVGKSRHEAKLPLPQDVGDAILDYLQRARPPVNSCHVFTTVVAPWQPVTRNAIRHATARAIRHAGVEAPSYGPHILRHSAATALLRQGASLQVIGEVLRHRSIDTTALYAKVDTGLLHQVARPWPGATSC